MKWLFSLLQNPRQYPFKQAEAEAWANIEFSNAQASIAATIGGLLVQQTNAPWHELSASSKFSALNVWDDFDGSAFAKTVEREFGISIPEADRERLETIKDLVSYILSHLKV